MTLYAYKPGRCQTCGGALNIGDAFEWGSIQGARVHVTCPAVYDGPDGAQPADSGIDTTEPTQATPAPVQPATAAISWSLAQLEVFYAMVDGTDNLCIEAVAGAGKSTTIVEGCKQYVKAYPRRRIRMVAFGAKNGAELREKVAGIHQIEAGTMNSAFNRILQQHLGYKPEVDPAKIHKLARILVRKGEIDREDAKDYLKGAVRLVGFARGAGIGIPGLLADTPESWDWLIDRFEVEFDGWDTNTGVFIAKTILDACNEDLTTIDFDDQLYQPARLGLHVKPYDLVVVDEAQDFNALQRYLTAILAGPTGRVVAVGDRNQAIFGFRGADFDSLDRISDQFDMKQLLLAESFRCPQAVVRYAQEIVPHIIACATAPEGSVERVDRLKLSDFRSTDAVLCRLTAPLVDLAFRCIRSKIPVQMLGRSIGDGLVSLIKKQRAIDLYDLRERLQIYKQAQMAHYIDAGEELKAEAIADKVACIDAIISDMTENRTVDGLIAEIEGLFTDREDKDTLTLATVHKSKGLEWPRVFILDPELMPSLRAKTDEQVQQERNLMYVARTRAKRDLRLVSSKAIH